MSPKTEVQKVEKVITWIIPEDALVKFEGDENACVIADFVVNNLEKYPVTEGDKIKVGFSEDVTEDGEKIVVFIQKVKNYKKSNKQTSSSGSEEVKELTINGVSKKTDSIIFEEEKDVWYSMSESVKKLDLDKFGMIKGTKVKITIEKKEKGNDIIKFIEKVEKEKKEKVKNDYTSTNATQLSIEAQASVNSANRIVANLVDKETDPETIIKMTKKLAEANFKLIQSLKE